MKIQHTSNVKNFESMTLKNISVPNQ